MNYYTNYIFMKKKSISVHDYRLTFIWKEKHFLSYKIISNMLCGSFVSLLWWLREPIFIYNRRYSFFFSLYNVVVPLKLSTILRENKINVVFLINAVYDLNNFIFFYRVISYRFRNELYIKVFLYVRLILFIYSYTINENEHFIIDILNIF